VIVNVIGPVIVAVHVNVNPAVDVIDTVDGEPRAATEHVPPMCPV
jgi:hypothetical protein